MSQESLGKGLRLARELKKLSLRNVESAAGISNAYLSQLENDLIKKPSPFFLHRLASLYGIDYETLMVAAGYAQAKTKPKGSPKTLAGAALFGQEDLSEEEEHQLASYLSFLRSGSKKK